ncbi:MAG: hypothetical protein C0597_12475, partial [Marinilabiliales bacterium]
MKKVLLINSNMEIFPYPVAPLGIALIASNLLHNYHVKVFDAAFNSTDNLLSAIEELQPDYIGIGIRNIDNVTMQNTKWYLGEIKENIIEPIKKKYSIPLIMGGSGFSIAPKEIFEYMNVDYGIVGEAENILPKLLTNLDSNIKINLQNVITKADMHSMPTETYIDLSNVSFANIDRFIDLEPYNTRGNYPIQTKRGCAHKCIYCSYPNIEGTKYRLRPVGDIVNEIQEVHARIPQVTFEFVDSVFNSPLDHAVNVCKEIIRRDLKLNLRTMGVNPGEVNEELIILMKEAGF